MSLPARAENVAVVRHALAGLAEEIGMDPTGIADLKTVVTEACMNVAVHAYDGEPGPLNVIAEPDEDGLTVIVRDSGRGIRPRADIEQSSLRLGLSLIAALSSSFSFSGGLDRGTEVEMRLRHQWRRRRRRRAPQTRIGSPPARPRSRSAAPISWRRSLRGSSAPWRHGATFQSIASPTPSCSPTRSQQPRRASSREGSVRLALADNDKGVESCGSARWRQAGAEEVRSGLAMPDVGGSLETLADDFSVEAQSPTAITSRSASTLLLLLPDLLADLAEGAAQDSGDVHL